MISPEYSCIRWRNAGTQGNEKKIEPEFRVYEPGTSGRSPAEVGACETVPADVRVRRSPSAADSRYSLLPHTEDVEGGNSKQPAAVQSQVAAFGPRGRGYANGRG